MHMRSAATIVVSIFVCLIAIWAGLYASVNSAAAQTPTPEEEPASSESGGGGYDPAQVSLPNQPPSALIGEPIYLENCAPCHGQTGDSDGPVVPDLPNPPPLFSDPETILAKSPAEYFHVTKFGRIENLMPPWGNRFSDDEIWHAAAYAWNLHITEEQVEAGRTLLEEVAADEGILVSTVESTYATRDSLFLTQQALIDELVAAYPASFSQLSETELGNIADYIRTLAIVPPWGATYRAGDSIVEGTVKFMPVDSTPSTSLANLPITLDAYIQFENVASFETTADEQGEFRFEGLSDSANVIYILKTVYQGVTYSSNAFDVASGLASGTDGETSTETDNREEDEAITFVEIPVYDTTEAVDELVYNRVNWVVDYAPGEIIVGQILSVGNKGEQTIVGRPVDGSDQPVTVELLLPTGANTIQFQDGVLGERYVQIADSVFDTSAVIPGEQSHQIFMSYRLPVADDEITLEQSFRYPLELLNLLVADIPDLEANVSDLTFVGAESVQNIPYLYWQGQDLITQTFQLELAGLIAEGEADPRGDISGASTADGNGINGGTGSAPSGAVRVLPVMEPIVPIMVGSAIFFLLAGLSIGPLTRMRKNEQEERLERSRERLLREIVKLDDQHDNGDIDNERWQEERSLLKGKLLSIAKQIRDTSVTESN